MITGIRRLNYDCIECDKLATIEIIRTNEDLPDGYIKDGTRAVRYCDEHLPQEVKTAWNGLMPEIPKDHKH